MTYCSAVSRTWRLAAIFNGHDVPFCFLPSYRRNRRSCRSAPLHRPRQQLDQLERHHADDGVAERLPGDRRVRARQTAAGRAARTAQSMITACSTVAAKNTTNRGSGCATMNCVPMMPARNPTIVFASPPMPMTPLDSASCTSPATRPRQQARHRARRQRDVDDDDQHQVDRDRAAHHEPRQRRLQRQRHGDRQERPRPPSLVRPPSASRAGVGVSTTSTSSSAEKSTAGLTVIRLYAGPVFSTALDAADHEALRDRCRRCPTSRRRRRPTTSAASDTYSSRSRSSPPPTTTPCARDRSIERAGRRVAVDEQLHLRRARARHDDAARRRRPAR